MTHKLCAIYTMSQTIVRTLINQRLQQFKGEEAFKVWSINQPTNLASEILICLPNNSSEQCHWHWIVWSKDYKTKVVALTASPIICQKRTKIAEKGINLKSSAQALEYQSVFRTDILFAKNCELVQVACYSYLRDREHGKLLLDKRLRSAFLTYFFVIFLPRKAGLPYVFLVFFRLYSSGSILGCKDFPYFRAYLISHLDKKVPFLGCIRTRCSMKERWICFSFRSLHKEGPEYLARLEGRQQFENASRVSPDLTYKVWPPPLAAAALGNNLSSSTFSAETRWFVKMDSILFFWGNPHMKGFWSSILLRCSTKYLLSKAPWLVKKILKCSLQTSLSSRFAHTATQIWAASFEKYGACMLCRTWR